MKPEKEPSKEGPQAKIKVLRLDDNDNSSNPTCEASGCSEELVHVRGVKHLKRGKGNAMLP